MFWRLGMLLVLGCAAEQEAAGRCEAYEGSRAVGPDATLPNLTLYNCDGTTAELDALGCDAPYRLLVDHCAWCPVSVTHLAAVQSAQSQLRASGVQVVVLVASDAVGGPPTSTQCLKVQETLGDGVRVVFDPLGKWREEVAPESDTWFLLAPPAPGFAGQRVVDQAVKPVLNDWLKQVAARVEGDVSVPAPSLDANAYAAPFCHDMLGIGYASIAHLLESTPNPITAEVTGGFCECAVGGHEAEFMDAYFTTTDYGAIFDGAVAFKPYAKEDVNYDAVYWNYLKPCAAHLDLLALDALMFGPGHNPACEDQDGNDATKVGLTIARGLTAEGVLNVAFNRNKSNLLEGLPPLLPLIPVPAVGERLSYNDRCNDAHTVLEGVCEAGRMSFSLIDCPEGCADGRCRQPGD